MRDSGADQITQAVEIRGQIFPEMHTEHPAMPVSQDLEVASRLGCLHHSKSVLLLGDGQIVRLLTGDLQEYAGVRAALVGLPSTVQESRAKPQDRCHLL